MEFGFHSRLFYLYLKQLEAAVANLHQQRTKSIDGRLPPWESTWTNAYDGVFDVSPADLLRYGMLLGRLAETYSSHLVAEKIFNRLAESAIHREPWIPDPASVLITAGEFNRRRGNLDNAESLYNGALKILEDDLLTAEARQQIHWDLGRVFYEFAYLHRLRGDACAAWSALQRSEVECDLAKDEVGAEIARTLLAAILHEEGFTDATRELAEHLSQLDKLVDDPRIKEANRGGFARRWVSNARMHLALTHLASGNHEAARPLIEVSRTDPSIIGFASDKRVEAQLLLAEGQLSPAQSAIGASWKAIEQQPQGNLTSTELAAATVAIAGIIHALEKSEEARKSALSCFELACTLPPNLHNRRAQAWAWAGRAILAKQAGDRVASLTAIQKGLATVQRCGAPIRAFLLELLRSSYSEDGPDLNDLKELVCQIG